MERKKKVNKKNFFYFLIKKKIKKKKTDSFGAQRSCALCSEGAPRSETEINSKIKRKKGVA